VGYDIPENHHSSLTRDPSPGKKTTDVFVQWKGTDACLDLSCDCGNLGHFDGMFAYALRCPACKKVWVMPHTMIPVEDDNYTGVIQDIEPDIELIMKTALGGQ
jgi:hypothetical protein